MKTPLEIIQDLKHVTYWSQPNIKYDETMALLNELEAALNPTEPEVEVIPAMIEDMITEAVEVTEEPVVEEVVTEEVVTEEVVTETSTTNKKATKK